MWTVQAPQRAMPQPNFVPVRPSSSRNTQRSGVSGETSIAWRTPLTWIVIIGSPEREADRQLDPRSCEDFEVAERKHERSLRVDDEATHVNEVEPEIGVGEGVPAEGLAVEAAEAGAEVGDEPATPGVALERDGRAAAV